MHLLSALIFIWPLPTFGKPRVISCAERFPKYVVLPRGGADDVLVLFTKFGIKTSLRDERQHGVPLNVTFQGKLRSEQRRAVKALLEQMRREPPLITYISPARWTRRFAPLPAEPSIGEFASIWTLDEVSYD